MCNDVKQYFLNGLRVLSNLNFILFFNESFNLEFLLKIILSHQATTQPSTTQNQAAAIQASSTYSIKMISIQILIDLFKGFAKASMLPQIISQCLSIMASSTDSALLTDPGFGNEFGLIIGTVTSTQAMYVLHFLFKEMKQIGSFEAEQSLEDDLQIDSLKKRSRSVNEDSDSQSQSGKKKSTKDKKDKKKEKKETKSLNLKLHNLVM